MANMCSRTFIVAALGLALVGCGSDDRRLPADSAVMTDSNVDGGVEDSSVVDGGEDTGTPPTDGGMDGGTDGAIDSSAPDTGPLPDGGPGGGHLFISELTAQPGPAEFFEIHNPGSAPVDLTDYFVADNSAYHQITSGPWSPVGTPETDFMVQFPPGTSIAAGGRIAIATSDEYETTYAGCPDFYVTSDGSSIACGGGTVPGMTVPPNGSAGNRFGNLLSNSREMVVLFRWDGSAATVTDVDYLTWGDGFDDATRIDKSAVGGYAADTARGAQRASVAPGDGQSVERCDLSEPGETTAGGNGTDGHDETSENLGSSFSLATTPTPGAANGC